MGNRSDPRKQRAPALKGLLMVDTSRGRLRIRKWPRKRGPPKHPFTRQWNDWFRDANFIAKRAAGHAQNAAIELTKGTGLYPRDIMLRAMSKGLMDMIDEDGTLIQNRERRLEKMSFNGCIIRPTANITIGAGAAVAPTWPLPVLDTFGFWNAGAPTLLTIPAGVEIVQLFAGGASSVSTTQRIFVIFELNGTIRRGYISATGGGTAGIIGSSGPMVVTPGDTVRVRFFFSVGTTLLGNGDTYFTLEVLQTTV